MGIQIVLVIILTFLINLITTLSYSVRIVGIRTGRIAISFALFNILVLISRTANGFQAPLLASSIEKNIKSVFRKYIVYMVLARIAGTLIAQVIFVPSAKLIAYLSAML